MPERNRSQRQEQIATDRTEQIATLDGGRTASYIVCVRSEPPVQILSGRITCAMKTSYDDYAPSGSGFTTSTYLDEEVLTWIWVNTPALQVSGSPQTFWARWEAHGSGFKNVHQEATSSTGHVSKKDQKDTWTTNSIAMVQFQALQIRGEITLSSPETKPPNGYTLVQTVVEDNILLAGYPTTTTGPSIALAVSIKWGSSIADLLNTLDPISVASPQPSRFLGLLRISRLGAPTVRGWRQDVLSARGPDAPLGQYKTIANWTWEITTQP